MTREEIELAGKMYSGLKEKITKHHGSESEFHRCFYREKINPDADQATLQRYVGRAMKDKHKKPEMVAGWSCFLEQEIEKRYGKSLTSVDGKAAWEFRLQVKSRITGEPGRPIGTSRAALNSTYELFNTYRKISGEYGPECSVFDELAGLYVDGPLRQFNTKWHPRKDIEDKDLETFKQDLLLLQNKSSKLCCQLEQLYSIVTV